jgi:hypothetical protein
VKEDRATREYYDRKVARAEEVAMPVVLVLIVVIVVGITGGAIWTGIDMLLR